MKALAVRIEYKKIQVLIESSSLLIIASEQLAMLVLCRLWTEV